jgi:hypothetical protein
MSAAGIAFDILGLGGGFLIPLLNRLGKNECPSFSFLL